jgi:adenylate kinase family enzyme
MTRIEVIGCSGGGKSTFARRLAGLLGLEFIGLDGLMFSPGWVQPLLEERLRIVAEACARPRRVVDGTWTSGSDIRFAHADLVIWLDLPRGLCLWRVVKRWATYAGRNRPELPKGCPEKIDFEFLHYIWTFKRLKAPKLEAMLEGRSFPVLRLKSRREVADFLSAVEACDGLDDAILVSGVQVGVHR